MVVAKVESNIESPQIARTFNACREWVSHRSGNIFLQICWEMFVTYLPAFKIFFLHDSGIAKMLLQLSFQLTLTQQL